MAQDKPQNAPNDFFENGAINKIELSIPESLPPFLGDSLDGGEETGPKMDGLTDSSPSLPLSTALGTGVSAWQDNKQIIALWSDHNNRNSWVGINGVGWRKLANDTDSGIITLTMLCAHAYHTKSPVRYREEGDGKIYKIYVG